MNNGSFHQSPAANHLLQLQYLPPAIAYGPAPEAGTRNVEGKHLIPAISYGSEPEQGAQAARTSPEREVIPVDGKEAEIMQMAESIERECFREAKSACEEGMHPAIYAVRNKMIREYKKRKMAKAEPEITEFKITSEVKVK